MDAPSLKLSATRRLPPRSPMRTFRWLGRRRDVCAAPRGDRIGGRDAALLFGSSSLDVQVVSYPNANPYGYHPTAARTAGVASSLTLRSAATGVELPVSSLAAPVRISIPLTRSLVADDHNPYFGARCDQGNRTSCMAELDWLNATRNEADGKCKALANSASVVFSQAELINCTRLVQELNDLINATEARCERLIVPTCGGRHVHGQRHLRLPLPLLWRDV